MDFDDPQARLDHLAGMEKLSDTLSDRDGGALFQQDLEEARALAAVDPRFGPLVEGLEQSSLGARMAALNRFFASFDPVELATLELPQHLGQLRSIFLTSK